jgi:hypothetical protein
MLSKMKKTKSTIAMLAFAMTFACILSCTEQGETSGATASLISDVMQGTHNGSSNARMAAPVFNGSVGDPLDLTTANQWIANYRSKNPDATHGHYFGFEIIQQILKEAGCVGIRIYYATNEAGDKKLLLVGVDSEGNDLLPEADANPGDGGNTIGDYSYPCPNMCPPDGL